MKYINITYVNTLWGDKLSEKLNSKNASEIALENGAEV